MRTDKIQNSYNAQFTGLWKDCGYHTKETDFGIITTQDVEYHAFKGEANRIGKQNINDARFFRFMHFNKDEKPVYNQREVVKLYTTIPFTESEYIEYKKNPNAETEKNDLIKKVIEERGLQEEIEFLENNERNFISLGTINNEHYFGNLLLDDNAKGHVTPLEEDLIEISKTHRLTRGYKWGLSTLAYEVGVKSKPIKSKNPIINLFYTLIGREHPKVKKNVVFGKFNKELNRWVYDSAETVRENVLKAFKQATIESDSTARNRKLERLVRKIKYHI